MPQEQEIVSLLLTRFCSLCLSPPWEEVPLPGPADLHCCSQWHSVSAAAPWQPLQEAEPGKAALLCFLRIMLCNWLFNHCLTWDSEIPHYLATRVTFNENKPIFVGENDSYTLKRWLKAQTQQIYFEKTLCKSLGEKENNSPKSGRKSIVDVAPQKPTLFCLPAMKTKETPTSLRRKETFLNLHCVGFFVCLFIFPYEIHLQIYLMFSALFSFGVKSEDMLCVYDSWANWLDRMEWSIGYLHSWLTQNSCGILNFA